MISKDQKRKLKTLISHYVRESVKLSWAGSYDAPTSLKASRKERAANKRLYAFIDSITEEVTCK